MGAKSRRKGASFEREIASRFATALGRDVKRRLGQARDSGHDLDDTHPYLVECKRRKGISVVAWYEQVTRAAEAHGGGVIPIVVMRADNGQPLVLMSLDDLLGKMRPELP